MCSTVRLQPQPQQKSLLKDLTGNERCILTNEGDVAVDEPLRVVPTSKFSFLKTELGQEMEELFFGVESSLDVKRLALAQDAKGPKKN